MTKLAVLDITGKEIEKIELPKEFFSGRVNTDVIHQAVVMYQAALRQGTLSTKTRAEVSGGGKKPFKQKGTGRARQGSTRSPLWHHGGVTFGPKPRDFSYAIPKKIKLAALRETLNAKYQDKNLLCLTDVKDSLKKTKEFASILKTLKLAGKTLALLDGSHATIERVSRNIPTVSLMRAQDVNAYDILRFKNLLVSKTALTNLLERIK